MELSDFSGGLYMPAYFQSMMPQNALLIADNVEFNNTGHISARRGYSLYATLPATVRSIWRHYPRSGNPATLAFSDNGTATTLYHDTASTGTFVIPSGTTSFATGKWFRFTNWASKDRSFFANGDGLWSYNGVATQVVQTGPQITGPYIVVHQSRLFGTKFTEINFSVYATDVNDELTVTAGNQLNVSDPQGGGITGLFSLPDRLLIMKSTSIWTMLGDIKYSPILTKLTEVGCLAPRSAAQAPYGVYFVSRDGVYLTDGLSHDPIYLSGAIEQLFRSTSANNVFPNAVGIYYPRSDVYVLKLQQSDPHCWMLFRIQTLDKGKMKMTYAWAKHTSLPLQSAVAWDSEGDTGDWYAGSLTGQIYHVDTGLTDAGTAYTTRIQTAALRLAARQQVGRIHYVYANYFGDAPLGIILRYNNVGIDDVTLSLGQTVSPVLQRTRQIVNDQTKSGQFVSVVATLPTDGYNTELYSLRLDPRLRANRVWR